MTICVYCMVSIILHYINTMERVLLICLRHLGWGLSNRLPRYNQRLMLISLPTLASRRKMLKRLAFTSHSLLSHLILSIPVRSTRRKITLCLPFSRSDFILNSNFSVLRSYNYYFSSAKFRLALFVNILISLNYF